MEAVMVKKSNGVLASALRAEIYRRDLTIKEVAVLIHRSDRVVNKLLAGERVGDKTIVQVEIAFPSVFA